MVRLAIARLTKCSSRLKELRIHLCQTGETSQGARDFIENSYVQLKSNNPKLPILVRECSGIEPVLWARFELGQETHISLTGLAAYDISAKIEKLVK